jgi:hypothetical protein
MERDTSGKVRQAAEAIKAADALLRRIAIFDGERLEVIDGWGVTKGGRVRAG